MAGGGAAGGAAGDTSTFPGGGGAESGGGGGAGSGGNGSGGGGGGGRGSTITGASPTLAVTSTGGDGGTGATINNILAYGGGGGGGGNGAVFNGTGTLTIDGQIRGGGGGNGGSASDPGTAAGGGGFGGNGLVVTGTGVTINVNQSIGGGNAGQFGAVGRTNGQGLGGAGVFGSGLTILNTNTISGGFATDGTTRADAITFTSGANSLTLGSGGTTGTLVGGIGISGSLLLDPGTTAGTSVTLSNIIHNAGNGAGSINKSGLGTLSLSGTNTYTGATTVNAGVLNITGSIAPSALTTVNANAALTGTGTIGATQINAGGIFAPGNGAPGTSINVASSLAFQSGAQYLVQINPATASFSNVTGTATLGGGTVNAVYANGSYVSKQYTILTAGSVSGGFAGAVNTNLPANFSTSLSYDQTHAYLNLALNFAPGPNFGSGLNTNQQQVANALTNFFNATGGIPIVFGGLTPAGLTQVSGEVATGSQQTTFSAMNQFIGVMTDPFIAGRADDPSVGGGASGYADEVSSYAGVRKPNDALAAIYTKAPPQAPIFQQRWSTWIAGYGGSQTTEGNVVLGSNATTSSVYGTAVGADYRISPDTLAGFALAGGGTGFSVAGSGSGRSDLFQAGAFIRHSSGPAYISAALAYGWQDVTTNRSVAVAGLDQYQARFNANAWSGRLEGGYRFAAPVYGGFGITPYAAGQFTTFDLPPYGESVLSGVNTFALAYNAKSVTDTRSELGLRGDKSFVVQSGIFTLRGRAAWAHDYDPDRAIAATFQTLPGTSFVVNGAAQARDSALTTAAAEMKWSNGWSVATTFEAEFSEVTRGYAGKGVVRYVW